MDGFMRGMGTGVGSMKDEVKVGISVYEWKISSKRTGLGVYGKSIGGGVLPAVAVPAFWYVSVRTY